MDKSEKYQIKDKILITLNNTKNRFGALSEISEILDMEFNVICTLSDELIEYKYLENRSDLATKKIEWQGDKMVRLTQKGIYFLNREGGFSKRLMKEAETEKHQQAHITLSRFKLKTDIAKNMTTILIAVCGGLYTTIDLIGSIISENFDLARLIINLYH